jgi:integrase
VAKIFKRCSCPEHQQDSCPHPWVVRYRTTGGRSSRQREQSFGGDLREAEDFALKVEHDKRAHVFVDPKAGRMLFRDAAETWLNQHLGADSSIATYRSVLRAHIDPAIGGKPAVRRSYQEDFQRAAAKAGLPPEFIPHSLRHLYASTALAGGISITEVSRWLGHKSIEVTHQISVIPRPLLLRPRPHRPRRRLPEEPEAAAPRKLSRDSGWHSLARHASGRRRTPT